MDVLQPKVEGIITITDDSGNIVLNHKNAIHYENFSYVLGLALSGNIEGHVHEMHFGNGGSVVNGTGNITYLPPNIEGATADLYNPTYYKVISPNSSLNVDTSRNYVRVVHERGTVYTDIICVCTLEYSEPDGQYAFDDAPNAESDFIFDEIGLKNYNNVPGNGILLTHAVFNPIQKSLNRRYVVEYVIRIQLC